MIHSPLRRHHGSPKKQASDVPVGARVKVPVRGRLLAAVVIEDRGHLGVHGQQVVRVRVEDPMIPNEAFEIEVPVDWLKDVKP